MKKHEKMIIYNLFPLLAGEVTKWDVHLKRASDMGFNWIFVNPIQKPGYSGSLYSISDYFSINPLIVDQDSSLSADEQVKAMIKTAEGYGVQLMVDLVINHCAFDASIIIKEHPEWFLWEGGEVVHPFCDEDGKRTVWGDLAKFNHRQTSDPEGLYQFFLKIINYLLDLGFRGFRCDAAYQLPRNLWRRLISDTRKKDPDILFFAETLGCTADRTRRTAEAGFNYIFNSSKWWDFSGYWLMEQYNLTREIAPSISFPESHDTQRLIEEMHGNVNALKQRYLFASLFSSGVMMPMGYEFGFRKKPHVVHTRPEDWETTDIDLTDFISKVNDIKSKYMIFQEEAPTELLHYDNPNILIMWKASTINKDEALLVLNKDIWNIQHFYTQNLHQYVQARAPLHDVSPEYPVEFIPEPFIYDINPGQGLVYVTQRDVDEED